MKDLKELKSLETLHLGATKVTAKGKAEIQKSLPRLRVIPFD
jgi:hypothetical protein